MNNMPTINNGGQPYYFPADIAKEGEEYARLSNFFKTRVGDNGKILTFKWYDQGRVMNVHGFIPFIQGMVGKHYEEPDTNEIVMAPDALYREWQGSTDNGHDGGFMDYILEDQMFPQEGIFKGHFGLKDTNGNVLTSVNIVFEVLGNDLRVGETTKYYSAELDRLAREYEVKTDQMVADGTQKVDQFVAQTKNDINASLQTSRENLDALNGEIRANRAEQANISQHLAGTQQQIANYDIVTRPEFQNGMDTVTNAINNRLSQMKTSPIAVANLGELNKKYPKGADGIFITADTGHKWVYLNDQWTDCGVYQAVGIANEITDPMRKQLNQLQKQTDSNTNDLISAKSQLNNNADRINSIESSGKLADVQLIDESGNLITDQNGATILVSRWLPIVDKTLTQSDIPADALAVQNAINDAISFNPYSYGLPVFKIWGNDIPLLKDKTKKLKDGLTYEFDRYNIRGKLKSIKVQGASSASYPKKNYTIQLDQDIEIIPNYGRQNKYVLKANYNDYSQIRNVMSAKMWGKIKASETNDLYDVLVDQSGNAITTQNDDSVSAVTDPLLSIGSSYGAIDGFPVALYINDQYWGLYTFSIPKDGWMAKMPKKQGYAILSPDWKPQGAFEEVTNLHDSMELEYSGTDSEEWIINSINNLINLIKATYSDTGSFDNAVGNYLDMSSAIDYYVYSILIGNTDGVVRNYLLQTFNGDKWYFVPYDLDVTFGRSVYWGQYASAFSHTDKLREEGITFENSADSTQGNRVFYQLWKFHKDQVLNRTKELITGVLSPDNLEVEMTKYMYKIPQEAFNAEVKLWPGTPETSIDNLSQLLRWYNRRVKFIQNEYLAN
ncbi:CotH kinase family protein [Lactobacillus taiwanensis]|uniref:CotH kinase family protein n=1 Tax=Lactobacillus taiwanensis TaxID=508451 RepID=UPI0025B06D45|nr:CotH kinase family protein [Lactobacillus taiwanensis]